ncbi:MAG TPA: RagB/SusD family nutrient uptake outer membrane protein [Chitinophagaceae bacterium]|nr:RagB/SusD family nutrient uptake outer membrane protein [Chitinophagaceae bacterium]
MKKLLLIISVFAGVTLVSCKKYLTSDSPSLIDPEYAFGSETDARKAVNSVYALFNQDAYTSRLSNNFTGNTDIECGGVSASPDNGRRDIWSFEATPTNGDLLTVWNNAYNAINRASECEKGLMEVSLAKDPNNKVYNNLLGETRALRALWYYWLMNHWGDVPLKITPSRAGDDFYLPRTGRDTILSFLIKDLIDIEPKMAWAEELDFGIERINREFVLGFIARLSMMRGGYWLYPDMTMKRKDDYQSYIQLANTYAKKLVELKPRVLPDYATVFMNQNKYIKPVNSDILYEVAFHPGFGDVAWNNGVRVDKGTHNYGSGSNYLSFPITYYHSFDTLDKRLPVTCSLVYYDKELIQQPSGAASIAPGKWNRMLVPSALGAASAKGTGINWSVMRYADVLLLLAESENELSGPTATAQDALRKVRQRAFPESLWSEKVDAYIASVSASKETLFDAIVNERGWEFGGECLRKYDLARWNLYGKKVAETRNALTQMGIDGSAGTGTYSQLPDFMYYKRDSTTANLNIVWYNKFTRPAVAPPLINSPAPGDNPDGYTRVSWTRSMYNTTTSGPADYILRQWRGYTDNTGVSPLRYILPLHNSVISNSLGVLQNQYGY